MTSLLSSDPRHTEFYRDPWRKKLIERDRWAGRFGGIHGNSTFCGNQGKAQGIVSRCSTGKNPQKSTRAVQRERAGGVRVANRRENANGWWVWQPAKDLCLVRVEREERTGSRQYNCENESM